MEFVRVPRKLIYDTGLGDKRIIAYSSILFHNWDLKECNVTKLITQCGYCNDRHLGAAQKTFMDLFMQFEKLGFFEIHNLHKNTFTFFSKSPKNRFGIIYEYEYKAILDYRIQKQKEGNRINHARILLLLSYIRLNMERQPGKPVVHFSMLTTISKNIGIPVRSISSALAVLEELLIIHYEALPRYKDEFGNWHTNVKVFVNIRNETNADYNWQAEVKCAIHNILASQKDYIGG